MVRTQVQLTEEQYRQLKRWAARFRISLSEAVRRCIEERMDAEKSASGRKAMVREALAVCGKYQDPEGLTDVAVTHDQHLFRAYRR
jgi:hypothetical protein